MSRKFYWFFPLYLLLTLSSATVHAGVIAVVTPDNRASISTGEKGIELIFDKNGRLLTITSTFFQPVASMDRRDIAKAYVIAEEKAKASVARFFNQSISASRVISELDESATTMRGTGDDGVKSWSKESSRRVSESLTEVITSNSSAILKGVQVMSRSFDQMNEQVKVVVGITKEGEAATQNGRIGFER